MDMREIRKGDLYKMIKSERGSVEISGGIVDVITEYGMLSEGLINSVPENIRLHTAAMLTEMLQLAIENTLKGGEENEKS